MPFRIPTSLALLLSAALLSSCSSQAAPAKPAAVATADYPAVVELFQSQGCSSCPPANTNVNAISDRPNVLTLSFAVTYWDKLGWKDRFAQQAFTERQWGYARAGTGEVATPQVIVNGRAAIVGQDRTELDRLIASSGRPLGGPAISTDGDRLSIAGGRSGATVWLVEYDPANREVPIRAGENSGRTLPHRHIVTRLVKLGDTAEQPRTYALPPLGAAGLQSAILVQINGGGPIVAAKRLVR
jgi:hypothetical protein